MRPVRLSSSTPYSLAPDRDSGRRPKKLPMPMEGSSTVPGLKPMFSTA